MAFYNRSSMDCLSKISSPILEHVISFAELAFDGLVGEFNQLNSDYINNQIGQTKAIVRALAGSASDGGAVNQLYAMVMAPSGNRQSVQVARNGNHLSRSTILCPGR